MSIVQPTLTLEINGEARTVSTVLSVKELLEFLAISEDRIAVELNRRIIRRQEWATTILNDHDRVEIVQFVGGG